MTDRPPSNGSAPSTTDDLNRVREILFGAEQRKTNNQITELRKDFEQRLQTLQADTKRELDDLRKDVERQVEQLTAGKVSREDLAEMFGGIVSRLGAVTSKLAGG